MTRDEARKTLEDGGSVSYYAWTWTGCYMSCHNWDDGYGPCCEDNYEDVEEALYAIERYCNDNWEEVREA